MPVDRDKRNGKRLRYNATMRFSYFNKIRSHQAQLQNYGDEGICFKSKVTLQPGVTVFIRLRNDQHCNPHGAEGRGLPSTILAEVKWCQEIPGETEPFYEIGAKFL